MQLAPVPFTKQLCHLVPVVESGVLQQQIGLSKQLHVRIFNAVVYHLHVMPGAFRPQVRTTRLALRLGGDGF